MERAISTRLSVTGGLVLALLINSVVAGESVFVSAERLVLYVHALCGIIWIGHIYYSNFTQSPALERVPAEVRTTVLAQVMPRGFFVTQTCAAIAVLTGGWIGWRGGYLIEALELSAPFRVIGIGMWLAVLMALIMCFLVSPAAQGLPQGKGSPVVARRINFSRVNLIISIPMLYCMLNAP